MADFVQVSRFYSESWESMNRLSLMHRWDFQVMHRSIYLIMTEIKKNFENLQFLLLFVAFWICFVWDGKLIKKPENDIFLRKYLKLFKFY